MKGEKMGENRICRRLARSDRFTAPALPVTPVARTIGTGEHEPIRHCGRNRKVVRTELLVR